MVREAYDADAYGNTLIFRNGGTPPAPIVFDNSDSEVDFPTCPFLFTGQRFDAETALYYYKRRFYLPPLGRFLSRDPVESDLNLYRYVENRPTNENDPTGLYTREDCYRQYDEDCGDKCRAMPNRTKMHKLKRALCWAVRMDEYVLCLGGTEEAVKCYCVVGTAAAVGAAIYCTGGAAAPILVAF